MNIDIKLEQYRQLWKKKQETTVTSPFGLHIGHYRSVIDVKYMDILSVYHKMMLMPFKFAMVLSRWAKMVQVLLEKVIGNPWSTRL